MVSFASLAKLVVLGMSGFRFEKDHVIEVYFVAEPQVFRNYKELGYSDTKAKEKIEDDLNFYVYQVNHYFKSMEKFHVKLSMRIARFDVMVDGDDELVEPCKLVWGNQLQADMGLELFREWLNKTNISQTVDYDIAVLFTGFDLFKKAGDTSAAGYATVKAACNKEKAVALVEFEGTQLTAHTLAHELAHSLGAGHDVSRDCPPSGKYGGHIMSATSALSNKNRWSFSACSSNQIQAYVMSLKDNCLLKTTAKKPHYKTFHVADRDILDPQKICQRKRKDKNSYFCAYDYFYNNGVPEGDLICQYLYCGAIGSMKCMQTMPTEGMVCAPKKRCSEGRCLPAPLSYPVPKSVTKQCVFGDIKGHIIGNVNTTCAEFVEKNGAAICYHEDKRHMCCETCKKQQKRIRGCRYGDRYKACAKNERRRVCPTNKKACCETCKNFRIKRGAVQSSGSPGLFEKEEEEEKLVNEMNPTIEHDEKTNNGEDSEE